jgi:hypothetical protein
MGAVLSEQDQGGFAPLDPPLRAQPLEPITGWWREGPSRPAGFRGNRRPLSPPARTNGFLRLCLRWGVPGGQSPPDLTCFKPAMQTRV